MTAMRQHPALAVIRRLLYGVPLIAFVVALTFVLIRLSPTDPAVLLAGDAPTEEFLKQVRDRYHLDDPIGIQLLSFVGNALRGDFGTSIYFQRPVFELIAQHFPVTLLLTVSSLVVAAALGVTAGVMAASKQGGPADTGITVVGKGVVVS